MARVWMVFLLPARSNQIKLNESAPTSLCFARFKLHPWIAKPTVVPSLTILNANRAGNKLLLCSSIVATHQPSREHRLHPRCQPDHTPSPPPIRPSSSPTYHPALLANLLSEVFPRIPPQFRRKPSETAESFPLGTYSLLGTVVTKVSVAWNRRDKYTREELTFSLRFRQAFS
jgi:hypothetical protein